MRRTNSFTLETTDFGTMNVEVYELRPLDLLEIHQSVQDKKLSGASLGEYERLLPLCTNLTKEQLLKLYPSEFATVLEAFKEVNRDFLAPWPTIKQVIEKVGLTQWLVDLLHESGLLTNMKKAISLDWQKLSVSLQSEDTPVPNSTDGGTSSSPSTSGEEPSKQKGKQPQQDKSSVH